MDFPPALTSGQDYALRMSTVELAAKALTPAQKKWLLRGRPPHSNDDRVTNYDFSAFGSSNFNRVMAKLEQAGMVRAGDRSSVWHLTNHGLNVAEHINGTLKELRK